MLLFPEAMESFSSEGTLLWRRVGNSPFTLSALLIFAQVFKPKPLTHHPLIFDRI